MENVKKFYDALTNDEALRERAKVLNGKDKAALVAFAKAEGYDFSLDDLEAYAKPLTDNDMESAAGGIIFASAPGDEQDEFIIGVESGPDGIVRLD